MPPYQNALAPSVSEPPPRNGLQNALGAFARGFIGPEGVAKIEDRRHELKQRDDAGAKEKLAKTKAWLEQTRQVPEVEREAWTMQNADAIFRDTGQRPAMGQGGMGGGMGASPYADAELDKAIAAMSAQLGEAPKPKYSGLTNLGDGGVGALNQKGEFETLREPTPDPTKLPTPPNWKEVTRADGIYAFNPQNPKEQVRLGDAPPPRGGITVGTDANGNPIVKIGGPGQDGQQMTGPTKPEASYYKDVGSYNTAKAQRETMLHNLQKARGLTAWDSTGIVGQVMKNVGGSKAVNLGERLKTVKTLIGFKALEEMRKNSPTGGALGNITEKEIAFLQSVEGSLEQIQSEEQLEEVLNEVEASIGRLAAAQDAAFQYQYQALGPNETRGQPRVGEGGNVQVIPGLDAAESEEFRRLQQKFDRK